MKKEQTARQLINTELAFRALNKKAKRIIKKYTPAEEQSDLQLEFLCECSDPDCRERISLTIKEYEQIHNSNARFVVLPGHQTPKVETIKHKKNKFSIVDKPAL